MIQYLVNVLDYFFNFTPPRDFPLQYLVWTILALSLLTAGFTIYKIRQTDDTYIKRILREYPGKLITLGLLLGINVLSRLNRVDVLSMRLITITLSLWIIYSFYEIINDFMVKFPKHLNKPTQESQKIKYHLHKNKKKKHRQR